VRNLRDPARHRVLRRRAVRGGRRLLRRPQQQLPTRPCGGGELHRRPDQRVRARAPLQRHRLCASPRSKDLGEITFSGRAAICKEPSTMCFQWPCSHPNEGVMISDAPQVCE
jgi:hypothetical protein